MSEVRTPPILDSRGLAKSRIEALADGIFAVAMTLLVLDIKSPINLLLALPTFAPSRLDRLLHPGAAGGAPTSHEDP